MACRIRYLLFFIDFLAVIVCVQVIGLLFGIIEVYINTVIAGGSRNRIVTCSVEPACRYRTEHRPFLTVHEGEIQGSFGQCDIQPEFLVESIEEHGLLCLTQG